MSGTAVAQTKATMKPTFTPVASGLLQRACACGQHTVSSGGECEECKKKRQGLLQRATVDAASVSKVPPIVHEVLQSSGQPLDAQTRAFMEPRFGHDFSDIRVHTDAKAAESAQAVNALAYTVGHNVVFGRGHYAPQTSEGQKLIAHELTHTVQQSQPPSSHDPISHRQPKLIINEPSNVYEQEADSAAKHVMLGISPSSGPTEPHPSSVPSMLQRAIAGEAGQAEGTQESAETPLVPLIVEDDVRQLAAGQMHKSEFLDELRRSLCIVADAELAAVGRSTKGCPYIEKWIGYYGTRDVQQIERAIRRYVPETTGINKARGYIPLISERVRQAVVVWAKTGQITGVPEGVSALPPESGGNRGNQTSKAGAGSIQFKDGEGGARSAENPAAIRAQLDRGQYLDNNVRSRMESAFGYDFSHVQIHTDPKAAGITSDLNARALTIGSDVAFASGEYQPGTLIGDALIAHELAHVMQQAGGSEASPEGQSESMALEEDADVSAIGAMVYGSRGVKGALKDIGKKAMPRLRSGLRLQRCVVVGEGAVAAGEAIFVGSETTAAVVTTDVAATTVVAGTTDVAATTVVAGTTDVAGTTALAGATDTTLATGTTLETGTSAVTQTAASTNLATAAKLAGGVAAATALEDTPRTEPEDERRRGCRIRVAFPRGGNAEHDALARNVTGKPLEYVVITPEGESKQYDGMDELGTLYDVKTKHDFLKILDLPEAELSIKGANRMAEGVARLRAETFREVIIAQRCGRDFRMATNNLTVVKIMREILGDIIDPEKIEFVNFR